jgi:hypothetical protein
MNTAYMGQDLLNPPSVGAGTPAGMDQQRLADGPDQLYGREIGDVVPGVSDIITRLKTKGSLSPEQLVDNCLDLLGPVAVNPDTKAQLLSQANEWGQISWSNGGSHAADQHVGQMLQLIVATREYQFA